MTKTFLLVAKFVKCLSIEYLQKYTSNKMTGIGFIYHCHYIRDDD